MASWPDTLPQSFDGTGTYSESPEPTVLRTAMDSGVVKLRRRQTRSEVRVSGTMRLTGAQVGIFIPWFQDTLKGGANAFTAQLTLSGSSQPFQFVEEPSINHVAGDVFQLSMKLLVLPV